MKTLKQLSKALDNANYHIFEWFNKHEAELVWHYVNIRGDMVSLIDAFSEEYSHGVLSADVVEGSGLAVYEEDCDDDDDRYKDCTRRVIKRLRHIERKIQEWEDKSLLLDCATELVHKDGTPYAYCEAELSDIARKLAALGVSI